MSGGFAIHVDCSHHPLVVTTVRALPDVDDLKRMQASFEELFARHAPFAALTDARLLTGFPSAELRETICDWNRAYDAEIRRWNVAGATAIRSAFARAALRSIQWLVPHPTPYAYTATMGEATTFACEHLAKGGVHVPEELRRAALGPSLDAIHAGV